MRVELRFFAILRERMGCSAASHEIDAGARVGDLWNALCAQSPQLAEHSGSVSFAVNREYVDASHALCDGDELALIPPVSGG